MWARDHVDKVGLLGAVLAALCCLGVSSLAFASVGILVASSLLNAVMLHPGIPFAMDDGRWEGRCH